jgi:hypothetical protein
MTPTSNSHILICENPHNLQIKSLDGVFEHVDYELAL